MTRRVLRARCPKTDKTKLTSQKAAEWWARHLTAIAASKDRPMPDLFTYVCRVKIGGCGYWHITSHPRDGSASYPIPDQRSHTMKPRAVKPVSATRGKRR